MPSASKDAINDLKEKLKKLSIYEVNDLADLDDKGWEILKSNLPSRADKLKDSVEKINRNKSQQKIQLGLKTKSQQLNEWHKVKRFLLHKSNMIDLLNKTAFLDRVALRGCFDDQKNGRISELKFGKKLNDIHDALEPFTFENYKNTGEHTGLLLHGPPGSGKTKIMEMIMNISGLTSLVKPISSSEINRALVGESERILRDIFNRAKEFPYLLCVIFVDEIDSFAPDRGNASQAGGAMANVNQLLALMDGVTWVPNNYLIGATNFYNKLDGAFLRRLRTKILIPNLDTKQRLEVIQSLVTDDKILYAFREFLEHDENWKFNSELQNLLKKLTINFSAAATSELKEKIRIKILSEIEKDINFKITIDKIIDYADKIADNQNIKISGQTIPSFIKNKRDCPIVQRMKILLVELWLI